jgi:hypothetical protein
LNWKANLRVTRQQRIQRLTAERTSNGGKDPDLILKSGDFLLNFEGVYTVRRNFNSNQKRSHCQWASSQYLERYRIVKP